MDGYWKYIGLHLLREDGCSECPVHNEIIPITTNVHEYLMYMNYDVCFITETDVVQQLSYNEWFSEVHVQYVFVLIG